MFSIAPIIFGLTGGKQLKALKIKNIIAESVPLERILQWSTKFVIIVFYPIIIIGAVWLVELNDMKLIILPVLGGFTLILGSLLSLLASRLLKLERQKMGSMFISGGFSNWGSFGVLICFVFLGEESLAFAALFMLLEQFLYYSTFSQLLKIRL